MDVSMAERVILCALLVPPLDDSERRKLHNRIFTTFGKEDFSSVPFASEIYATCEKVHSEKKVPTIAVVEGDQPINLAYEIKHDLESAYRYSLEDAFKTLVNRRKVLNIERMLDRYHKALYKDPIDEIDPDAILHDLRNDARKLHDNTAYEKKFTTLADIMGRQIEILQKKQAGEYPKPIPSGIPELDTILLGGFHKSQMISICARPSVGKSQVGMLAALHAAREGYKVLYVNLEMNEEQIGTKAMSYYTGINSGKLDIVSEERPLSEADWESICNNTVDSEAFNRNITLTREYTYTMEDLEMYIQDLKDDNKCDIVFLDYLGLLQIRSMANADEYKLVTAISRRIKAMSLEFDIPMVSLVQLNRSIDKEEVRTPRLSDIRSSGAIEQDSDVVIFLDVVAKPEDKRIKPEHQAAVAEWMRTGNKYQYMILDVLKQRGGRRNAKARSIVDYSTNRFYAPSRYIDFGSEKA